MSEFLWLSSKQDLIGEDYVHDQDAIDMLRVILHEMEGNIRECTQSTFPTDVASIFQFIRGDRVDPKGCASAEGGEFLRSTARNSHRHL